MSTSTLAPWHLCTLADWSTSTLQSFHSTTLYCFLTNLVPLFSDYFETVVCAERAVTEDWWTLVPTYRALYCLTWKASGLGTWLFLPTHFGQPANLAVSQVFTLATFYCPTNLFSLSQDLLLVSQHSFASLGVLMLLPIVFLPLPAEYLIQQSGRFIVHPTHSLVFTTTLEILSAHFALWTDPRLNLSDCKYFLWLTRALTYIWMWEFIDLARRFRRWFT